VINVDSIIKKIQPIPLSQGMGCRCTDYILWASAMPEVYMNSTTRSDGKNFVLNIIVPPLNVSKKCYTLEFWKLTICRTLIKN